LVQKAEILRADQAIIEEQILNPYSYPLCLDLQGLLAGTVEHLGSIQDLFPFAFRSFPPLDVVLALRMDLNSALYPDLVLLLAVRFDNGGIEAPSPVDFDFLEDVCAADRAVPGIKLGHSADPKKELESRVIDTTLDTIALKSFRWVSA
jgi:hypothetical protein